MEKTMSKISTIDVNEKFKFGRTALYKAIEDNDFSQVENLLSQGADINARDNLDLTPLHFAASQNVDESHYKVAELLLKNKADVNAREEYGMTPLYFLVKHGNVRIIQLFLDFKPKIKTVTLSKETLLFPAVAYNKNVEVVQMLIKLGLKANHCTSSKNTPLHHAFKLNKTENNVKIVEELLKNKADLNALDSHGLTPVDYLVHRGNHEMLKLLFDSNAVARTINKNRDYHLSHAVRFSENPEVVTFLLNCGSKINLRNGDGKTPLHNAVFHQNDEIKFKIAEILLKRGADVDARDKEDLTPLFNLVKNGNLEIVQLFLSFNANPNVLDEQGQNLLFPATQNKNVEVLQLLIDQGLNIDHRSKLGSTPLHMVCENKDGRLKNVKCLLKNGANMSAVDNRGCLPLVELFVPKYHFQLCDEINEKYLKFILEHTDFSVDHKDVDFLTRNHFIRQERAWKIILDHFAKLKTLKIPVNQPFLFTVSKRYSEMKYRGKEESDFKYFDECLEELSIAKSTKLPNTWITFFDLLVNDRKKLKNYAGNSELIEDLKKSNCEKKFPIYGASMNENVKKGIKRRQLFDMSSIALSDCLPMFNPNHLVIRDVLDCILSKKDLLKLCG